jgi:hypothetical protein
MFVFETLQKHSNTSLVTLKLPENFMCFVALHMQRPCIKVHLLSMLPKKFDEQCELGKSIFYILEITKKREIYKGINRLKISNKEAGSTSHQRQQCKKM